MMRPDGNSHLRLSHIEWRPTALTQSALDEMETAGLISLEVDGPQKTYRPLTSLWPLMAARSAALLPDGAEDGEIPLFERI